MTLRELARIWCLRQVIPAVGECMHHSLIFRMSNVPTRPDLHCVQSTQKFVVWKDTAFVIVRLLF